MSEEADACWCNDIIGDGIIPVDLKFIQRENITLSFDVLFYLIVMEK